MPLKTVSRPSSVPDRRPPVVNIRATLSPMTLRVAVLDDYQRVALRLGDWTSLDDAEVIAFDQHISDEEALVAALTDVDVVVAMRERTALPASVVERLPRLQLIVTTGLHNPVI